MTGPSTHLAKRPGSTVLHVVTGVARWYNGQTATSECGVRMVAVMEHHADRNTVGVCKRCRKSLGWDLEPTVKVTVKLPDAPVNPSITPLTLDQRHLIYEAMERAEKGIPSFRPGLTEALRAALVLDERVRAGA